jgi:hypothetical protein
MLSSVTFNKYDTQGLSQKNNNNNKICRVNRKYLEAFKTYSQELNEKTEIKSRRLVKKCEMSPDKLLCCFGTSTRYSI